MFSISVTLLLHFIAFSSFFPPLLIKQLFNLLWIVVWWKNTTKTLDSVVHCRHLMTGSVHNFLPSFLEAYSRLARLHYRAGAMDNMYFQHKVVLLYKEQKRQNSASTCTYQTNRATNRYSSHQIHCLLNSNYCN